MFSFWFKLFQKAVDSPVSSPWSNRVSYCCWTVLCYSCRIKGVSAHKHTLKDAHVRTTSHLELLWHSPPLPPSPPGGRWVWGRRRPYMGGPPCECACRSAQRLSHTLTELPPLRYIKNDIKYTLTLKSWSAGWEIKLWMWCCSFVQYTDKRVHTYGLILLSVAECRRYNHKPRQLCLHCQNFWISIHEVRLFTTTFARKMFILNVLCLNPRQSLLKDFFHSEDWKARDRDWILHVAAVLQQVPNSIAPSGEGTPM